MGAVPRRRALGLLGLVAASSIFALAVIPPDSAAPAALREMTPALPLDDAYIFIRFAQQLARGHSLEWTDGVGSSGATSMAYLGLLLPGQVGDDLDAWVRWSRWVGWATLFLLGLISVRLFRALGLQEPLPWLGGVTLVLSGPVGWGAVAGMESALNAAAVLLACALWIELLDSGGGASGGAVALAAIVTSLLPLFRPENALLVGLGCVGMIVSAAFRGRRWWALVALVPGAALGALNLALTGTAKPAGALAKSITEFAFVDGTTLRALYSFNMSRKVLPAYTGQAGEVLWPPVGWIALLVAVVVPILFVLRRGSGDSSAVTPGRFLVPVLAWWVLLLSAPLSAMVDWQYMRHHHAGLALAWVIAWTATAVGLERVVSRSGRTALRWAAALVPLVLLTALPTWRSGYEAGVADMLQRHGPAGDWLASDAVDAVVLLNDAGYLAVRHDGAMIDVIGLGTPVLARAYRHGAGASIEALARLGVTPDIAAVNRDVFHLEALLGESLGPERRRPTDTHLARVKAELLTTTALGDGLDFAHLPSEVAADVRWQPPPPALDPSRLVTIDLGGTVGLQGCRPLAGTVSVAAPPGPVELLVGASDDAAAELIVRDDAGQQIAGSIVPSGGWRRLAIGDGGRTGRLTFERVSAELPCLESLRPLSRQPAAPASVPR